MTRKLSAGLKITPYMVYHFKICIADVGDGLYDSAVMLRANSFASSGKINMPLIADKLKMLINNEFSYFNADSASIVFIPNVEFDFNSFAIPDTSVHVVDNLISILKYYFDFKIDILGYSDNIGSNEYNAKLSLNRAKSVSDFLISHNIDKSRINSSGMGSVNPLADNSLVSGRAKNRLVTIKLYK